MQAPHDEALIQRVQSRSRRILATWIGAVGIAPNVVSVVFSLAGPTILVTFNLTYDRMGLLLSATTLGAGAAALVAGMLLEVVAVATLARGALLVSALACVAGSLAPAWGLVGAAMFVFGTAVGALVVIPLVFWADIYPADRMRVMVRWQLALSIAAVALPLIVGVVLTQTNRHLGDERGWRVLLGACTLLWLVLLALAPRRSLGKRSGAEPLRLDAFTALLRSRLFHSILLLGMMHAAADNTTYVWMVLMVKQRFGVSAQILGLLVSAYSIAYMTGRLVGGTVRWPLRPPATIALGSFCGSLLLVAAVRAPTVTLVIAIYSAAGVFLSLNWPSVLGYAGECFPKRAGTAFGAINAASGPGMLVVSAVTGVVSRLSGDVATGMLVPIGTFFALSVFAGVTHLRSREASQNQIHTSGGRATT